MFWNILARSSSGPGRRPFTAETRVRFPYGSQLKIKIKDMANHKSALKEFVKQLKELLTIVTTTKRHVTL